MATRNVNVVICIDKEFCIYALTQPKLPTKTKTTKAT